MPRNSWICRGCGTRNERVKRKCPTCARAKPKRRVPEHAKTLRDDSYETYAYFAEVIHGITDESCCVCGKPRSQERRHDRDHGHNRNEPTHGKPRGLACPSCNIHMPRTLTLEKSRLITAYLERAHNYWEAA